MKLGTKTRAEREDEEAERLIRPSPKMKPPRRDLRREIVQETDRDKERDLTKEEVEKKAFALVRTFFAKGDLVTVQRKEDEKTVNVSKETLKSDPSAYQKIEDKPEGKPDADKEVNSLLDSARNDPKVEYKLRSLFDSTSPLGGIADGNPDRDAGAVVGLPKGLISFGDLKDALAPHMNSKGFIKAPKPATKKKGPQVEEPKAESKPDTPKAETSSKEEEPKAEAPKAEAPKAEAPKAEAPTAEGTPPSAPAAETPPTSEGEAPKAKKEEAPKGPVRRKFSEEEQFKARERLYASLPPTIARKFFDAHPDDIRTLVAEYKSFKSVQPEDADIPIEKLATTFQIDPEKVPAPTEVLIGAKKVALSSLPKEVQEEKIRTHQLTVVAASLAARSLAIKGMRSSGVPGKMAAQLIDSSLRVMALPEGGPRETAQRKEAKKLFLKNSVPKMSAASERFGGQVATVKRTSKERRKNALAGAKGAQKELLRAAYAGEDFAHGMVKFGPKAGDAPWDITNKLAGAETFFKEEVPPSDLNLFHTYLGRVRDVVERSDVPKRLISQINRLEKQNYKAQQDFQAKKLADWKRSHEGEEPPPGLFEPPATPHNVDLRNTQSKLRDIFASYSPYPPTMSGVIPMDKKAIKAAEQALLGLDRMATTIESNQEDWGMNPKLAAALVTHLEKIADDLEDSIMGTESMQARQAALLEGESDEKDYMSAFESPMGLQEGDADEKDYMSLFNSDDTEAVHEVA